MNVAQFIKWLEKQPQHLEVCVVEVSTDDMSGAFGDESTTTANSVCFDDPQLQSRVTDYVLVLGVE